MPTLRWCPPGTKFHLTEMPEITGTLVKTNDCRAVVKLDRPDREVEFEGSDGEPRKFTSHVSKVTSWAPTTLVTPVGFEVPTPESENTMSKKTKTTKTTSKKPASAKSAKATAPAGKKKAAKKDLPPLGIGCTENQTGCGREEVAPSNASEAVDDLIIGMATGKVAPPTKKPREPKPDGKMSALDAAAVVLGDGSEMGCQELIAQMQSQGLWTSPGGKTPAATLYAAITGEIKKKGTESRFAKAGPGKFRLATK